MFFFSHAKQTSACAPLCCKNMCCASRLFARVVGELRAADPSNVQGPVKQNASPGEQSEAPRPRSKQGQEQNSGPENQDNQHMLEQPRGSFPENRQVIAHSVVKTTLWQTTLLSRRSFPTTDSEPPDPRKVSEGFQKWALKRSLKGFRRVLF